MATAIDEIMPEVFRLLQERVGMDCESFGAAGIEQAVRNRISTSGAGSPRDYLRRLVLDPDEFQELIEDLVVPETWFFRDMLAFRALAGFLDAGRGLNRPVLRVLSVGCSTGEEVYSLAIALREAGLTPPRCLILGTDLSQRALELATEGTFAPRSFRGPDEQVAVLRERWFNRHGNSWRVSDELRAGVQWRCANLAEPEFLPGETPFHVVFCRNVLIYFHAAARRIAVRRLHRLLSPDGVLWSAPAEARIFNEAGFASLGSECPLAFRHRDAIAAASPPPAIADEPSTLVGRVGNLSGKNASTSPVGQVCNLSRQDAIPSYGSRQDAIPSYASRQNAIPSYGATKDPSPASKPLETVLNQSAAGGDFSWPALLRAARDAADSGRLEEADALCSRMLERDLASAEAHCLRGVIHQAQGRLNEARRSFEKALYLNPRHYEALVHMMLLAEQTGDSAGAANYRRRADRVAPGEAE